MDIIPVRNEDDLQAAREIRTRVFVEEQDCAPEEEWDGHDETSRHVLGTVEGTPVATARWRAVSHGEAVVAKLERFAVLSGHRGEGYGTQLVEAVLGDARHAGFETFLIHSQARLEGWYEQFGFESTGRRFEEAGIPHVEMIKREGAADA